MTTEDFPLAGHYDLTAGLRGGAARHEGQTSAQPAKACLLDWDGTLRPGFLIVDWLWFLSKKFELPLSFHLQMTTVVGDYFNKKISYTDFATHAEDIYVTALHGLKYDEVRRAADSFVQQDVTNLFPYAVSLIKMVKRYNYYAFILSGAPLIPIQSYSHLLTVDHVFALDIDRTGDGIFKNKIKTHYALKEDKNRVVNQLIKNGFEIALAFGDTESDEPLLDAATYPFLVGLNTETIPRNKYVNVTPDKVMFKAREAIQKLERDDGTRNDK